MQSVPQLRIIISPRSMLRQQSSPQSAPSDYGLDRCGCITTNAQIRTWQVEAIPVKIQWRPLLWTRPCAWALGTPAVPVICTSKVRKGVPVPPTGPRNLRSHHQQPIPGLAFFSRRRFSWEDPPTFSPAVLSLLFFPFFSSFFDYYSSPSSSLSFVFKTLVSGVVLIGLHGNPADDCSVRHREPHSLVSPLIQSDI